MKMSFVRFTIRSRLIESRPGVLYHVAFTLLLSALICLCMVPIAQAAIFKTDARWPSGASGYTPIRVCIDPLSASSQRADGAAAELLHNTNPTVDAVAQRVKIALQETWEANSSVRFYGWEHCDTLSEADLKNTIKLLFQPDRDNYYDAALKQVNFAAWGKSLNRCISPNRQKARVEYSFDCAEQYAIHEFGHALGFADENGSDAAAQSCHDDAHPAIGAEKKNYVRTAAAAGSHDTQSVMAYGTPGCVGQDGKSFGSRILSDPDIRAVQKAYPVTIQALASSELYFGGAYGFVQNGVKVNNPATGAQTCPLNYKNAEVYGASGVDWPVNICYRERSAAAPDERPIFDFGGMWGYVNGNATNNPVTGTNTCPTGFDPLQVLNTSGLDWTLTICYRQPAANPPLKFGGTISYRNGQLVPNQVTLKNNCTLGYSEQAVLGTINVDWPFSFCYAGSPKQSDGLDFGGAYGYINNGSAVVNPITNGMNCPTGHSPVQAFGTYNVDWSVFMCYRPHKENIQPDYDFGGMWGYINNGTLQKNPVTGGASCASGYRAVKVLGTANQDWDLNVCYRRHVDDASQGLWFGGVIGTVEQRTVNNPATGSPTCPPGYVNSQLLGTYNQDWPLSFCYAAPLP